MLRNLFKVIQTSQKLPNLRTMASATCLKYNQFGEPSDVIYLCKEEIDEPKTDEVLVKILAAPINPADINTIQGKYPVKVELPAIGGNECVGEVLAVGSNVSKVQPGDRIIPFATGLGTWRSLAKYCEKDVMKISNKISIPEAATITVNPCTAYRMLKDFVDLKPGDTIIQNGANSAVGQAVHQLCKAWGINSVGVVRNRPDIDQLRNYLKCLGASEILTEEEIRTTKIFQCPPLSKPKLAFNCVGGKSATEISRHLANNGCMVTYGGMSREPITVATAALIFKNISFRGYWMTRWTKENSESPERLKMFDELCCMIEAGVFKGPLHEMIPVNNFKEALCQAANFQGLTGKKFILDFTSDC